MARNTYTVTAPDGTVLVHTTRTDVVHAFAVIGYMRLKKARPRKTEVDPFAKPVKGRRPPVRSQEEVVYDHFKAWVMIGTSDTYDHAVNLGEVQGWNYITEETVIIPVTPVVIKGKRPGAADDEEDDGPVAAATGKTLSIEEARKVVDDFWEDQPEIHTALVSFSAPEDPAEAPAGPVITDNATGERMSLGAAVAATEPQGAFVPPVAPAAGHPRDFDAAPGPIDIDL